MYFYFYCLPNTSGCAQGLNLLCAQGLLLIVLRLPYALSRIQIGSTTCKASVNCSIIPQSLLYNVSYTFLESLMRLSITFNKSIFQKFQYIFYLTLCRKYFYYVFKISLMLLESPTF